MLLPTKHDNGHVIVKRIFILYNLNSSSKVGKQTLSRKNTTATPIASALVNAEGNF